jgi:hypothetical protein
VTDVEERRCKGAYTGVVALLLIFDAGYIFLCNAAKRSTSHKERTHKKKKKKKTAFVRARTSKR